MWQKFLDLLAAARRPLAVLDFETAGLGGAPPVEFAVMYWAPWCEPSQDETSRRARALCPPGLTYAASWRLDPGVPIDPEATLVHGIRDEDVRGKARSYKDMEVMGLFGGLSVGSAADNEGPAVFVGHNAAEADVPWAERWGYINPRVDVLGLAKPAWHDVIDTMRMQRRLVQEHPHPLVVDAHRLGSNQWMTDHSHHGAPVVGHGLKPYATSLDGLHTALFGDPHDGGHGALADACATVRCLAAMLELWSPLYSVACPGRDQADDLTRLLAALDAPPPGQVSWDGWLGPPSKHGQPTALSATAPVWGRKARKHTGKPLDVDPSYARWVCSLPTSPTGRDSDAWCSPLTRDVLTRMVLT